MKRFLFAMMLVCTGTWQLAGAATFEEANQLYEREKFAEAKRAYEEIAKAAPTANVYYNLGNAEYRLKQAGRAAWNYERALALEPEHTEARMNLELIRRDAGARLLPEVIPNWLVLPLANEVYTVAAALAAWAYIFAMYGIIWGGRRESFRVWSVAIFCATLTAYSVAALWLRANRAQVAIVLEREASARVAPADRAATVEPLPAASQVKVLTRRGAWIYCELPGRGRGWLPEKAVALLNPEVAA